MPNNDHAGGNPQMSDPASQNQSSPSVTSSPSKTSQEGTKGFSRAYLAYVQSITSLRAFASELNPAVQESARKGRSLIDQAVTRLHNPAAYRRWTSCWAATGKQ